MNTTNAIQAPSALAGSSFLAATVVGIQTAWDRITEWRQVIRSRQALLRLSEHELKDIGLTRVDANAEGRRWFWEV